MTWTPTNRLRVYDAGWDVICLSWVTSVCRNGRESHRPVFASRGDNLACACSLRRCTEYPTAEPGAELVDPGDSVASRRTQTARAGAPGMVWNLPALGNHWTGSSMFEILPSRIFENRSRGDDQIESGECVDRFPSWKTRRGARGYRKSEIRWRVSAGRGLGPAVWKRRRKREGSRTARGTLCRWAGCNRSQDRPRRHPLGPTGPRQRVWDREGTRSKPWPVARTRTLPYGRGPRTPSLHWPVDVDAPAVWIPGKHAATDGRGPLVRRGGFRARRRRAGSRSTRHPDS